MTESKQNDDVAAALAILQQAGFPVERIRILPATDDQRNEQATEIDRQAVLAACCELLADGMPRSAKEFTADLRGTFPGLTRKVVSSILTHEGKERVSYDREGYTYSLS